MSKHRARRAPYPFPHFVAACLFLVALVVACGGQDGGKQQTAQKPDPSASAEVRTVPGQAEWAAQLREWKFTLEPENEFKTARRAMNECPQHAGDLTEAERKKRMAERFEIPQYAADLMYAATVLHLCPKEK